MDKADVEQAFTASFYEKWCYHQKAARPHQTPPTFAEFKYILCEVLTPEEAMGILRQFDGEAE